MYNFLWDGKPDKIKRETITQDYEHGGLKMTDIETFIWSLKAGWVKRLAQTENNKLLKTVYETNFRSPYPRRLHIKFGFARASGFGEDV